MQELKRWIVHFLKKLSYAIDELVGFKNSEKDVRLELIRFSSFGCTETGVCLKASFALNVHLILLVTKRLPMSRKVPLKCYLSLRLALLVYFSLDDLSIARKMNISLEKSIRDKPKITFRVK